MPAVGSTPHGPAGQHRSPRATACLTPWSSSSLPTVPARRPLDGKTLTSTLLTTPRRTPLPRREGAPHDRPADPAADQQAARAAGITTKALRRRIERGTVESELRDD